MCVLLLSVSFFCGGTLFARLIRIHSVEISKRGGKKIGTVAIIRVVKTEVYRNLGLLILIYATEIILFYGIQV